MFEIFADASNILKLRLCLATIFNVVVVATFCQAGQMLIDEVARISKFSWTTLIEIFSE
jgi:hypothetical protein